MSFTPSLMRNEKPRSEARESLDFHSEPQLLDQISSGDNRHGTVCGVGWENDCAVCDAGHPHRQCAAITIVQN